MTEHMFRRGPDGHGYWLEKSRRIGLGHRRLAIVDLTERGAQPMPNGDGTLVVTFNGEIYNYPELRAELASKGVVFRSHSDTEVLLHLYAAKGDEMVRDLRGMFAFAIWDESRKRLFLARDPYGIKPLYYSRGGHTFRFSSQIKSLAASGGISKDRDDAGIASFLLFGSVAEPLTILKGVAALPAGCTLVVDRDGIQEPSRYFSIAQTLCDAEALAARVGAAEVQERTRACALDSVRHHLLSDVPVGAFISAGIDSNAVVGLMQDAGATDIQSVTVAFDEFRGRPEDESILSAMAAAYYGTKHSMRVVTEAEFGQDMRSVLDAMDQPSIDGINTWYACKAAKESGLKLVMSGVGGDELFGGYPSFIDIPKWRGIISRVPTSAIVPDFALSQLSRLDFKRGGKIGALLRHGAGYPGCYLARRGLFMPWQLPLLMGPEAARAALERLDALSYIQGMITPAPSTEFGSVVALESSLYLRNQLLRDADWASMNHSIELRVPLVDSELLKGMAALQCGVGARATKEMLALSPSRPVPHEIRSRKKSGFALPIGDWIERNPEIQDTSGLSARGTWAQKWAMALIGRGDGSPNGRRGGLWSI